MPRISHCKLLSFGRGGHSEDYARDEWGKSHLSGYDSPDIWKPRANTDYTDCLVVDKRAAVDTDEGFRHVFRGPMVNVDLVDDEREDCPEPSPIFATAMLDSSISGGYAPLMASQLVHRARKNPAPGPLDYVSPAVYLTGWRAVGARTGKVINGAIVWD